MPVKQWMTQSLKFAAVLGENRSRIAAGVAVVHEQRLAGLHGQLDLAPKHEALLLARRVIAVVVEAGFAYGDDDRAAGEASQLGGPIGLHLRGVVGMNAGGREQCRSRLGESDCRPAGADTRTGDDDGRDVGGVRSVEHLLAVVGEGGVGQIGADVDHGIRRSCSSSTLRISPSSRS